MINNSDYKVHKLLIQDKNSVRAPWPSVKHKMNHQKNVQK